MLHGGVNLAPAVSHMSCPPVLAGALLCSSSLAGAGPPTSPPLLLWPHRYPPTADSCPPWTVGSGPGQQRGDAVPCCAVPCVLLLAAWPRMPGQLSSPPAAARGRRAVQLLQHGGCFEIPGLPSVLCKSPNLTAACGPASGPSTGAVIISLLLPSSTRRQIRSSRNITLPSGKKPNIL